MTDTPTSVESGTLAPGEPHPMAFNARRYIADIGGVRLAVHLESLASCAIEGNHTAEVCSETLRRLMRGESVSDRYVLGLAWFLMESEAKGNGFDSLDDYMCLATEAHTPELALARFKAVGAKHGILLDESPKEIKKDDQE